MASISFSNTTVYNSAASTALVLDPRVYNGTRSRYCTSVCVDNAGDTILTLTNLSTRRSQTFNVGQGTISFSIDFSDNLAPVNLAGGNYGDYISGGSAKGNVLSGGDGKDTLESFGDFTRFYGGNDLDRVTFENMNGPVVASLGLPLLGNIGFGNLNLFSSIERLVGSSKNDVFFGNDKRNTFGGLGGADYINGGGGSDTSSYLASDTGVNVNLTTGANTGGDAEGDKLVSIENLNGSRFDDTLTGDGGNNRLVGAGGADSIYGMGGDDRIGVSSTPQIVDGGEGIDTLLIQKGSTVVLTDANFKNIERINVQNGGSVDMSGVSTGQRIVSQSNDPSDTTTIVGSSGDDRIFGGKGVDDITGGAGDDAIFAGTGAETFRFDQIGFGRDVINNADLAKDTFNVSALGSTLLDLQFDAINGGMDTRITGTQDPNPGDAVILRGITVAEAQTGNYTFT